MIDTLSINQILKANYLSHDLKVVAEKVYANERITFDEGVMLYNEADLSFLGQLANHMRVQRHGQHVFFNRNFHIEPTNLCLFTCKFCSYSRTLKQKEDHQSWFYTEDEILELVKAYDGKPITEVHIVGGVHPKLTLEYFCNILDKIKAHRPELHVKAFTAVEIEYMFRKAKLSYAEGLKILKEHGFDSMPGGGAEIFDWVIRKEICADKCNEEQWLAIHKAAHENGIPSNATMLYGHIENYEHRIDHMNKLRNLQDDTKGFNCFIPLKYRNSHNEMSHVSEISMLEDLKNYAVSRIYLDNFNHLKAYWPMIGRHVAQLSLNFGVDDLDGTIDDSTKIYSMAGAEEQNPQMTTAEIVQLIKQAHRHPVERDTVYNIIKDFKDVEFKEDESKPFIHLPTLN